MSDPPRQPPKRATRGTRTGWAWLNTKLPWQLKKRLNAAAAEAGRPLTDEIVMRLEESFRLEGDAP